MSGPRVLHVDDDREFLSRARDRLAAVAGIETVPEPEPSAATDRLDDGVDLLLCGQRVTDGDGRDLIGAVRETHPRLPIVVYAAERSPAVAADVLGSATDYTHKPREEAGFAALAARIGRAVDAATDDRDRLTALNEGGLALSAAGTPAAVHEATVEAARATVSCDRCVLYHERADVLEPVATDGTRLSEIDPRSVDEGAVGRCYRTETAVHADDASLTPGGEFVAVPVGQWGVLAVVVDGPDALSAFDRDLVTTLGAQAGAALDRVAREQTARTYRRGLVALHDATREFMDAGSVAAAATDAVEVAADLLDPPLCAVHRHDPEADRLNVLAQRGATESLAAAPRAPGEGAVGRAFERAEPVWVTADADSLDRVGGGRAADDEYGDERDDREHGDERDDREHGDEHDDGEHNDEHNNGAASDDGPTVVETPAGVVTAVAYPLGEHGVLTLYADEVDVLDDRDGTLGRVLAANTEAVLDRLVGERALRRREAQLERQNERLERFASLVSHDLRSPLEVARGNVELATLADQDPAERLDKALTALDRADELIDDMLTFARQGKHVTEVSPVGVERVARAAWPAARTETDTGASGELVCDTDCRVRADESRLRQLLENLFRNALEHNDETVSVGVHETADGFAVTDDGTGLPSLSPQELFDPGTTTSEAGTGFGLSIVREIADAHGWTVSVGESETGGARFEFVTDPTA